MELKLNLKISCNKRSEKNDLFDVLKINKDKRNSKTKPTEGVQGWPKFF